MRSIAAIADSSSPCNVVVVAAALSTLISAFSVLFRSASRCRYALVLSPCTSADLGLSASRGYFRFVFGNGSVCSERSGLRVEVDAC